MFRGPKFVCLAALAGLCCMVALGCSDDPTTPPINGEGGDILSVPLDFATILEALNASSPGDTIELVANHLEVLGSTVVIESNQTPLVIRGEKNRPTVVPPDNGSAFLFRSPASGTSLEFVNFVGGNPTVRQSGGMLTMEECVFVGGVVHVLPDQGASLTSIRNLMRDPGLFGIQAQAATVSAFQTTVYRAGDCAMLFTNNTQATVENSILSGSTNYGLACQSGAVLTGDSGCNDVFGSGTASYLGCTEPDDDFSLDPEFCDPDNGDFKILDLSPCAPANSGDCGLVGALGVGCTPSDR